VGTVIDTKHGDLRDPF